MSRSILSALAPLFCLALLALSCTQAAPAPSPAPVDLATQVEATLQALVPSTTIPVQPPTTTPPPSATQVPPTETATPTVTATPEVSVTPTASATGASGDPRSQLGEPAWQDSFTSGSNWTLGEDSFTRAKVEDGKLFFTGLSTMDGWRLTWPEIDDFYLETEINSGKCEGNDHFGLIFRVPDRHAADEGYLFGLTCDGRYWLRLWDGETMTTLVPLTASAAIRSGAQQNNRIGVRAEGSQLELFANGQSLEAIEDETLTDEGGFGLFVGPRKSGSLTVSADEMAYWTLP